MPKEILLWEVELHYKQLPWTVQKQPFTAIHFFIYRYYYATASKLKSTITRNQILAAPGNDKKNVKVTKSKYKYNTLKNSEKIIAWLLLEEHLAVYW